MLSVRDLTVRYGRTPAVEDLSFEVGEGEIVGLVGPNGAGKSTTLAAIVGLVPVARGGVTFLGESLAGLATEEIARRGVALVLEGRHIFGTLTVGENLGLGRTANRDRARADAALERALESFPILRQTFRRPAGTLSGGEQQQLAIARALIAEPRLLLLDEPSLGLAPILVAQVFQTIREINGQGTTVLLVEQNALQALSIADRGYVLQTGEVVLTGSGESLKQNETVRKAYLGED